MSSDAKQKIDLDAELGAWPQASQKDADARVEIIVARLGTAGSSVDDISDDALFAAPFEGDSDFVAPSTAEREKDRQNLRDLAKLATDLTPTAPVVVLRGRESREEDSGIVDLAEAAKADPEAVFRAKTTQLASEGLFDEPPVSRQPPSVPSIPGSVPSIPIVALSSRRLVGEISAGPSSTSSPRSERGTKRGVPLYLAGLVAITAAAAAFFFLMKGPEANGPVATVTTTQVPATATPSAPSAAPEPASSTEPATSVAALDPMPTTTPAAPARPVVAMKEEAAKPVATKPSASAPASTDLASQIRKEMGDEGGERGPEQLPAAGPNGSAAMGNVPQKPSQGAITGALGVVLPEARDCLGPDDPVARATIVFGANGAAQSVNVTPAGDSEVCIKTALMKAKVTPFAEPTFTATTNVRHK